MNVMLYNMMSVILTAILMGMLMYLFRHKLALVSEHVKLYVHVGYLIIFFTCSIFIIQALINEQETILSSLWALGYAILGLTACGGLLLLGKAVRNRWKAHVGLPMGVLSYFQCFLLGDILLWHILPYLMSFWITIPMRELQGSDLILLLALCESGILLSMMQLLWFRNHSLRLHPTLDEEEYRRYLQFLKHSRHNHNQL